MGTTTEDVSCKTFTTLAILTLRRHKDGIWIQKLVEALQDVSSSSPQSSIQVVVLDSILSDSLQSHWRGLVNRVSDAAEPWEVKACLALLQLAKLMQIRVWNGPEAFSLCTHKWCHHVLFQRANLKSPDTVACLQQQSNNVPSEDWSNLGGPAIRLLYKMETDKNVEEKLQGWETNDATVMDYLVKPNAGGYGAGIQRRSFDKRGLEDEFTTPTDAESLPCYSDRFVLFQKYMPPYDDKIYRVWFLMGKVQCAVVRSVTSTSSRAASQASPMGGDEEFTLGCVGGVCQRSVEKKSQSSTGSAPYIQPWSIPDEVRIEIEQQLLPSLPPDVHCGSVEFLYSKSDTTTPTSNRSACHRLYFDLNLLSTLPVDDTTPWKELATAILKFCILDE
jgi:hypothetical protein